MVGDKKSAPRFWAKTTGTGQPGMTVYDHMRDVGYVARLIAATAPSVLNRFDLQPSTVGALAALHDLGKISPGFQRKCAAWLEENELMRIDRNCTWDSIMESDHGKVSHAAIQAFLLEAGLASETAKYVSAAIGGHHGRLNWPHDTYCPKGSISENTSGIDWEAERTASADMIWSHFNGNDNGRPVVLSDESPALWWLAGIASVADWIGSDESFFATDGGADDEDICAIAQNALDQIGFQRTEFIKNLSFHDLFHDPEKPEISWIPNEMQERAVAAISGPGVYVIEAPMGIGKTEAALWAAYRLLVSQKATGIYFALPTQATSNRMHLRMNAFLQCICPQSKPSRLIHSNSWLTDQASVLMPGSNSVDSKSDDARTGRDWFASAKRALISPFGVGTIDQALLGVVAAKHFFVRHFALAGKVVILDEIHSYDLYTGTLIDKLITTLEGLGCTVIVLSATLTRERLGKITPLPSDFSAGDQPPYPLISGRKEGCPVEPVAITPPESRTVKVDFVDAEKMAEEAIELAQKGGAVLWVCNTVDVAQKQYQSLMKMAPDELKIGLLHSRFPFWRRKQIEDEWMERFGKGEKSRCGSILVSTQIVEQSVDLDADLLITELSPTDMLLQRLGRLWRHSRKRPVDIGEIPRLCIIDEKKTLDEFGKMEPEQIIKDLGSKAYVYAPYILIRSLEVWKAQSVVSIPSLIRPLIEATYRERVESDSWGGLYDDLLADCLARKMWASRNCNFWQPALEDSEGIQTRLNEVLTIDLVLCNEISGSDAVFIDGSAGRLDGDQYRLETAQAIHKNLVKVPRRCFDRVEPYTPFKDYLFGNQSIGLVAESGEVDVKGLKVESKLIYSDELGLEIENKRKEMA